MGILVAFPAPSTEMSMPGGHSWEEKLLGPTPAQFKKKKKW